MDYKQAGVDIDAGNEVVRRIRTLAQKTFTPGVLSDLGSFGGLFSLSGQDLRDPVLVSSADGVGTKLRVAFMTRVHSTIGTDLVNHCVNDILVQGAQPLFFLDYLATGRLEPDVAVQVVDGLASACRANGCALLGGETAEMPGFYADGEYDLAGFIVGIVHRAHRIDGRNIEPGDVLIGLPSSGLHTNGYSLARRIVFEIASLEPASRVQELGTSIGDALLVPHRSYLPVIRPLLGSGCIKGMAHITGGGLVENPPRAIADELLARIDWDAWPLPPAFDWLQQAGGVSDHEMRRTFNCGVGFVLIAGPDEAGDVLASLLEAGEDAFVCGELAGA